MAPSAFLDRAAPPGKRDLQNTLGPASPLWAELHAELSSEFPPLTEEWGYSGRAYGWALQLKQKKRTVLYLIPCAGHFVAAFALGEKACAAARARGLPKPVLEVIESARRYPEGRGVRLEVRSRKDLANVKELAAVKMEN